IIVFFDRRDLTVVDANAAALEAYGYEHDAFIGRPSTIFLAPGESSDPAPAARADTATGLHYEVMHRRSDGTLFPVEVHANTADVDGRPTIIATIRDITERRLA